MSKKVTMRDIADKLGISVVSVSKAFSGQKGVSEELRRKIKKTADMMGYKYGDNVQAKRTLSDNVGIIVAERYIADNSFYFRFMHGLLRALQQRGRYAVFHTLTAEDEENNVLPEIFTRQRADGMIVLGQVSDSYIQAVLGSGIPAVFLDFYNRLTSDSCVICDNFYAAYEMTNFLIDNGHRRIGFVGNIHTTSSIQDRYLGYVKSLIEHDLRADDYFLISDRDTKTGKFTDLVLPEDMPTAFVCNCDQIAARLVARLAESGYRVPEDVSVTGFDNSVYSSICTPNITTFEVNTEQMSEAAVDELIARIKTPSKISGMIQIKGEIIRRDSVSSLN